MRSVERMFRSRAIWSGCDERRQEMRERIDVGSAAEAGKGRPGRPARSFGTRGRPGVGPRPVRPATVPGGGRSGTTQGERAGQGAAAGWRPVRRAPADGARSGGRPRVRVACAAAAAGPATYGPGGRVLDVARAVVVAVLTALVVVGLGLLADSVSVQRTSSPNGVTVTQEAPGRNP